MLRDEKKEEKDMVFDVNPDFVNKMTNLKNIKQIDNQIGSRHVLNVMEAYATRERGGRD